MKFYSLLFRPDDAKNEVIKPDTIVKNLAHLVDMLALKSKREKCGQDSPQKYSQEAPKPVERTSKTMEQIPVSVPIQVHCDVYPFGPRFGPGPDGN